MGTHQELLAHRGIYFKLYQLQYKDQELNVAPVPPPPSIGSGEIPQPDVTTNADV